MGSRAATTWRTAAWMTAAPSKKKQKRTGSTPEKPVEVYGSDEDD